MKTIINVSTHALLPLLFSSVGVAGTGSTTCVVTDMSGSSNILTQAEVNLEDNQHHVLYQENGLNFGVQKDSQNGVQLSIYNPQTQEIVALAYASEAPFVMVVGSKPLRGLSCRK